MTRYTQRIDAVLAWVLVALMAAMTVTVTWQVATRYLLGSPSSITEELATFLLIWVSLLGAAYALRVGAHLGVDVVVRRLRGKARRRAEAAVFVVVIAFSLIVLLYGGSRLVYVTIKLNQLSAALQVPMGYVYLVLPLSGLLMVYYAALGLRGGTFPAPPPVA